MVDGSKIENMYIMIVMVIFWIKNVLSDNCQKYCTGKVKEMTD